MYLFYQPQLVNDVHHLDEDESRHCVKVLRLNEGSEINIVDGSGCWYKATITQANSKKCEFRIDNKETAVSKDYYIHIAIAPTKNLDRIEWFTEKAVEMGIDEISFVICNNSERKAIKIERIIKKAISAMKQSLKATLPKINKAVSFKDFIRESHQSNKYIAYVDQANPDHLFKISTAHADYSVLIGPEGDFSKEELKSALDAGYQKVSLGNSRLRTETAGLSACQILNLRNE